MEIILSQDFIDFYNDPYRYTISHQDFNLLHRIPYWSNKSIYYWLIEVKLSSLRDEQLVNVYWYYTDGKLYIKEIRTRSLFSGLIDKVLNYLKDILKQQGISLYIDNTIDEYHQNIWKLN